MKLMLIKIMKKISRLIFHKRLIKFGLVGVSGILVNNGLLYLLTEWMGLNYKLSSPIAIELSIVSNFLLNFAWTWKDRGYKKFLPRLLKYHISAGLTAFVFNWSFLVLLTELFHLYYILSNIIGIGLGMFSNFLLNHYWTFREKK